MFLCSFSSTLARLEFSAVDQHVSMDYSEKFSALLGRHYQIGSVLSLSRVVLFSVDLDGGIVNSGLMGWKEKCRGYEP